MDRFTAFSFLSIWLMLFPACGSSGPESEAEGLAKPGADGRGEWVSLEVQSIGGPLGERLDLWRRNRLWRVADDPFLLSGFKVRPGTHSWQGEHAGKWLHSASLALEAVPDERLATRLQEVVHQLLASQEPNGYMGTYLPEKRFYAPFDESQKGSWDIWTHRYNLYGLLTYERFHPDPKVIDACIRMGDLLIETFGPGKRDLTEIGTRRGISSSTLLESMVMLYERTREERFLRFAEHLIDQMEANEGLKLVSRMLAGEDVSGPGDGKAYQLMAVLLGLGEMYRNTGEEKYLQAAIRGWENIQADHLYHTGGPWSYKLDDTKNRECFAPLEYFHSSNVVETCSTTTWIQLSLLLLRMTGEARFAQEAEKAILNHLIGAQSPDGIAWAYYTIPNCKERPYSETITCCASSGPRALEMYARQLVGIEKGHLQVNSYLPSTHHLEKLTGKPDGLRISGNYPFEGSVGLDFDLSSPVELEIHFSVPTGVNRFRLLVDGVEQTLGEAGSGYRVLRRVWQPGESVQVVADFGLREHTFKDRDGVLNVGFSYGPLALAQEVVSSAEGSEGSLFRRSQQPGQTAEPKLIQAARGSTKIPTFQIEGTQVSLIPYYLAGSQGGGVRTLFPLN